LLHFLSQKCIGV